jgi:hypothetical protein
MALQDPRTEHNNAKLWWGRCRDVIAGADRVKAKREQYLPRLSGQDETEYVAYVTRANFFNGTQRTLASLVGSVFRVDPATEIPDAPQKAIEEQLADITLDGVPFLGFAIEAVEEVLAVGRFGVLVDMPGDTGTAADRRPYWVSYEAEQIINWNVTKTRDGYQLSLVVLKEEVDVLSADQISTEKKEQFRVLRLVPNPSSANGYSYQVEIHEWILDSAGKASGVLRLKDTVTPTRTGKPLEFIPFVFINPTTVRPSIEKPPLLDMVDVNLSHYRSSADYEHGLHFTGLPTPYVIGAPKDGVLKIGSGVAWMLDGPNAGAGMVEFTGQGLQALEKALESKVAQMDVLGARLMDKGGQAETAEAVRSRYAAAHATLKTIVTTVSQALTQALRWHVWWSGADVKDTEVTVKLNQDFFETVLSPQDVQALILAHQSGEISFETLYFNLRRGGLTRPDVDVEAERELITKEQEQKNAAAMSAIAAAGKAKTGGDGANPGANPNGGGNGGTGNPGDGTGNVPPSGGL